MKRMTLFTKIAVAVMVLAIAWQANIFKVQADESVVWEDADFNITYKDGYKVIGGRTNVQRPPVGGNPGYTENTYLEGFSARGFAKLKKSRHVEIPEGVNIISSNSFIGRTSGTPDNFIETLKLPKTLKIIEYGAFAYNKIKGTVEIPEGVIYVGRVAFIGNQIEKVILPKSLETVGIYAGKPYYLQGIGARAFQANKIKEIIGKGNINKYEFCIDNHEKGKPDAAPFSNQELDDVTIHEGEAFRNPIDIKSIGQEQNINSIAGFNEGAGLLPLESSSYFKQDAQGKYVAVKTGKLEGLVMYHDEVNHENRNVASARFSYEILPKLSTFTVTFINENLDYAKVEVQAGHAIKDPGAGAQKMPADPSKNGYKFMGWNLRQDGKGAAFTADTVVNSDMKVYAIYDKLPVPQPSLNTVPHPTNGSIFPVTQVPECPTDPWQRQLQQPLQRQSDKNNNETVPKTGEATSCGALLLALAGTTTLIIGLRKKILPQVK